MQSFLKYTNQDSLSIHHGEGYVCVSEGSWADQEGPSAQKLDSNPPNKCSHLGNLTPGTGAVGFEFISAYLHHSQMLLVHNPRQIY